MAEKKIPKFILDVQEMQAKKEAEMVQKIIEKVKAECKAQGEDVDRRGYTKHYSNNS